MSLLAGGHGRDGGSALIDKLLQALLQPCSCLTAPDRLQVCKGCPYIAWAAAGAAWHQTHLVLCRQPPDNTLIILTACMCARIVSRLAAAVLRLRAVRSCMDSCVGRLPSTQAQMSAAQRFCSEHTAGPDAVQYSTGRALQVLLTSWQLGPSVDGPLPSSSATALPCFKRGQCIKDGFPAESGKSMVLGSACQPASVH